MTSAKKKKPKKVKKARITKIFIEQADDMFSENEGDGEESGMFLEKEDIQIIYNSLRGYKPTLCVNIT